MVVRKSTVASRFTCALTTVVVVLLLVGGGHVSVAQTPTTTIQNGGDHLRLQLNYDGGLYVPGTYNPDSPADSIPAAGAGTRMMWYPAKAAFRAGRITSPPGDDWDPENIGVHSVAFGEDTRASGYSSMAVGLFSEATNTGALAVGAFGPTASGYSAVALGEETAAIGDHATAMGEYTTAATSNSLTIGECNSANATSDNSLFVAGNGSALDCESGFSGSDALVLKKNGNLSISGVFEGEPTGNTFAGHFRGNKDQTDADGPDSHIALIENTNSGISASGLAIQTGRDTNPVGGNNFLTFYDGDGDPVGHVDGNGSGGVNFESGGADYAEELPVAQGASIPAPTELVGVQAGSIGLDTDGADRVMVVSSAPAVTGNTTPANTGDDVRRVPVAFVGQVPVKVRGTAQVGDLIVASGHDDGTARAVAPTQYRRSKHGPIAGQAWTAKSTSEVGTVTLAVGLGTGGVLAQQLEAERQRNDEQAKRIANLEQRLTALENTRSTTAGVSSSWILGGTIALLLLGGGIGAVLRRRRW